MLSFGEATTPEIEGSFTHERLGQLGGWGSLVAGPDVSPTMSTGAWSASSCRTATTRSGLFRPRGIVSPGAPTWRGGAMLRRIGRRPVRVFEPVEKCHSVLPSPTGTGTAASSVSGAAEQDRRRRAETREKRRGNVDAQDHVTEAGATRRAAPEPANGRWNLRGRAGNYRKERQERGVRVLCPALHAHVACLRCMRRWADRLTCSRVDMSERRAGQHTSGQNRCRSHGEEPLPHRSSPSCRTPLH
jgi:hypothetical protein